MPRPTTKNELLTAANLSFEKLTKLWDGFTAEQAHRPFPAALLTSGTQAHWQRDRRLRDVVIHLHEWHNLLVTWVNANQTGTPTSFP
ncbi:ClbS/DfsB family four-helix bundle protein [Trueperella pyogenes]|uniref:ClbS/DfsB family four-helix bundle protein n=1 Tax=Trueperella pyogenes TaxID=1661 RepID=UPI0031330C60